MLNAWRVQHQQTFFLWAKINPIKKEKQRRQEKKGKTRRPPQKQKWSTNYKSQTPLQSLENITIWKHITTVFYKKKVLIQLVSRCSPLHHMHIEVSWMIHLLLDFPYSYQDAQAWPKPKQATINKQKKEPEIRNHSERIHKKNY